jgi:hypothetical protein
MSIRAENLHVILRKIILGLDGKNSNKDAQMVDFQFSPQKTALIPLFRLFKLATKKTLFCLAEILCVILTKMVLGLYGKNSNKDA